MKKMAMIITLALLMSVLHVPAPVLAAITINEEDIIVIAAENFVGNRVPEAGDFNGSVGNVIPAVRPNVIEETYSADWTTSSTAAARISKSYILKRAYELNNKEKSTTKFYVKNAGWYRMFVKVYDIKDGDRSTTFTVKKVEERFATKSPFPEGVEGSIATEPANIETATATYWDGDDPNHRHSQYYLSEGWHTLHSGGTSIARVDVVVLVPTPKDDTERGNYFNKDAKDINAKVLKDGTKTYEQAMDTEGPAVSEAELPATPGDKTITVSAPSLTTEKTVVAQCDYYVKKSSDGEYPLEPVYTTYGAIPASYSIGNLAPGTAHDVKLRIIDRLGQFVEVEKLNISTTGALDTTSPEWNTPNVISTEQWADGATLTWNAATDNTEVVAYNVYNNSQLIQSFPGTATSGDMEKLQPETNYNLTIKAVDAAGNESTGAAVAFTTHIEVTQYIHPPTYFEVEDRTVDVNKPIYIRTRTDAFTYGGTTKALAMRQANLSTTASFYASISSKYKVIARNMDILTAVDSGSVRNSDITERSFYFSVLPEMNGMEDNDKIKFGTVKHSGFVWNGVDNIISLEAGLKTLELKSKNASPATDGIIITNVLSYEATPDNDEFKAAAVGTYQHLLDQIELDPPVIEGTFAAALEGSNDIKLTWGGIQDANFAATEIYRNGVFVDRIIDSSIQEYLMQNLVNGVYKVKIKAYDAYGKSVESEEIELMIGTPDTQVPAFPQGAELTAIPGFDSIDLSWPEATDDSGIEKYQVIVDGGTPIDVLSGTSYKLVGLTENTEYSIQVKAFDTFAKVSQPLGPVTVKTLTAFEIVLNADNFNAPVYYAATPEDGSITAANKTLFGSNGRSTDDMAAKAKVYVAADDDYYVWLRARVGYMNGTTPLTDANRRLMKVKAGGSYVKDSQGDDFVYGQKIVNDEGTFTWHWIRGEKARLSAGWNEIIVEPSITDANYTRFDAVFITPKEYLSSALPANAASFATMLGDFEDFAPPVINSFQASPVDRNTLRFTWDATDTSDFIEYEILQVEGSSEISKVTTTAKMADISGLTPNTTYEFKLVARDGWGNSAESSTEGKPADIEILEFKFSEATLTNATKATAQVRNNATAPMGVCLIAALRDTDGRMVYIDFDEKASVQPGDSSSLEVDFAEHNGSKAGLSAYAFLWDSTHGMKPLVEALSPISSQ